MRLAVALVHGAVASGRARAWRAALADVEATGVAVAEVDAADPREGAKRAFRDARPEFLVVASPDEQDVFEASRACAAALGLDELNLRTISPAAIRLLPKPDEDAPRLIRAALASPTDARALSVEHRRFDTGLRGKRVSRRALFTGVFSPAPVLVPLVDASACKARHGCSACVAACPAKAFKRDRSGARRIEADACDSCGLCVAACPAGAIRFPPLAGETWDARMRALLAPDPSGTWTLLVGSAAALEQVPRAQPGVLPVVVPCAGAIAPSFILHTLGAGARGVVLLPCPSDARCAETCRPRARIASEASRAALRSAGRTDRCVAVAADPREAAAALAQLAPAAPSFTIPAGPIVGLVRTALQLLGDRPAGIPVATSPGIPAGLTTVHSTCTLCGLCAEACPTGALRLDASGPAARLLRTHADCKACAVCVGACPERALALTPGIHAAHMRETDAELATAERGRCRSCGAELLPRALLESVAARARQKDALRDVLDYCPSCRLLKKQPLKEAAKP